MIRAGVIGAGKMGGHHARVYAALTGSCALVGVYDPDADRAGTTAARWDARAYDSLESLLDDVDVVSIASPSSMHFEHAALAIERGKDVLIEKPVALTSDDARLLTRLASLRERRPVVQVGHIEHFNPAIRELRKLLASEQPVAIDMQRLGPFDGRVVDADVVQDLMLHDIHVLLSIAGSEVDLIQSAGRALEGEEMVDYAVATFAFSNGLLATLTASRITEDKIRRLTVTTRDAHISVDSMQRTVQLSRWTSLRPDSHASAAYHQESVIERVFVPIEEPLVAQLQGFLRCVRERSVPEVSLSVAEECMAVVARVREQMRVASSQPLAELARA